MAKIKVKKAKKTQNSKQSQNTSASSAKSMLKSKTNAPLKKSLNKTSNKTKVTFAATRTKKTTKSVPKSSSKSQNFISKDMTIGEVVSKYPETALVMMNYGLHCVGCHIGAWETVEQGAMGHGMDEKTFEKMVTEMNKVIAMRKK